MTEADGGENAEGGGPGVVGKTRGEGGAGHCFFSLLRSRWSRLGGGIGEMVEVPDTQRYIDLLKYILRGLALSPEVL